MPIYRDEVAIIRSLNLGEADKIFTLFGKNTGKFSAVAKGIRKLNSRKRGHLETFNLCTVACAEGKSLDIITEAESIFSIDSRELSIEELARIGFAGRTLHSFVPERVSERRIYDKWKDYITGRRGVGETGDIVLAILDHQGFLTDEREKKLRAAARTDLKPIEKYVDIVLDTL